MAHGEIQRVDAAEILGIEGMLAANLRTRLSIEILRQAGDDWIEYRDTGNGKPLALQLQLVAEVLVDDGEQDNSGLAFD